MRPGAPARFGEDNEEAHRRSRGSNVVQPRQLGAEHLLVEQAQRASRLVLRHRSDTIAHRKRRQEGFDFGCPEQRRVALAMKIDEAFNPAAAGLLRSIPVVLEPIPLPYTVGQQDRRRCLLRTEPFGPRFATRADDCAALSTCFEWAARPRCDARQGRSAPSKRGAPNAHFSLGSMPIVIVELAGESGNAPEPDLAQQLANAIGRALLSPPGQTWVRLRWLARHEYAENESPLSADRLPVFITIVKREIPTPVELQSEVAAVTAAVAGVVGRAADGVHIEYAPAAAGRVSLGGKVVP